MTATGSGRRQTKRGRNVAEDAGIIDPAAELLRSRSHRGQHHVVGRVHAGVDVEGQVADAADRAGTPQFFSFAT